jgi:aminoglycoside 3-N-acetyltransferase
MDQDVPHTVGSLAAQLRDLGVKSGDVVLLHSSMKSLGFVVGGSQAVVQALLDVVGSDGTVVVPTHTSDNGEPAYWQHPPVPQAWWPVIREQAPGFDPAISPSRSMGVIAETVRTWPGALRSNHPFVSFAALGAQAADITAVHQLDDAFGDRSPLGATYRLDGLVLLLGCGHGSNTSLHLAEWRQPSPPRGVRGSSVRQPDGRSEWVSWTDVMEDESDFVRLGADFEAAAGSAAVGQVGNATCRLMSQRRLVDYATGWSPRTGHEGLAGASGAAMVSLT